MRYFISKNEHKKARHNFSNINSRYCLQLSINTRLLAERCSTFNSSGQCPNTAINKNTLLSFDTPWYILEPLQKVLYIQRYSTSLVVIVLKQFIPND